MFHPTSTKSGRIIFAPLIRIAKWLGEHHPVFLVKVRYFLRFHKRVNLRNPQDLNEKILWLKLFSDTSLWTFCADKYKVREYVSSCGLADTLVPLYGVWYSVDDFSLRDLPNSFILKANNGDGKDSNLIVWDKNKWNDTSLRVIIDKWLHMKHIGALSAEPQYKNIVPCVTAEELLPFEDSQMSITDYKIWCVNGKAQYVWVVTDRSSHSKKVMTYDLDWNPHPEFSIFNEKLQRGDLIAKPENFDHMISIAETLADSFPCVRIDLYNVKGKVYFGEITFTSTGGMMYYYTSEFLSMMGNKIILPR